MSIDATCKGQLVTADRMFMDFKYTKPGSREQVRALKTLNFLLSLWFDFLCREAERMDSAQLLEVRK